RAAHLAEGDEGATNVDADRRVLQRAPRGRARAGGDGVRRAGRAGDGLVAGRGRDDDAGEVAGRQAAEVHLPILAAAHRGRRPAQDARATAGGEVGRANLARQGRAGGAGGDRRQAGDDLGEVVLRRGRVRQQLRELPAQQLSLLRQPRQLRLPGGEGSLSLQHLLLRQRLLLLALLLTLLLALARLLGLAGKRGLLRPGAQPRLQARGRAPRGWREPR